MRRKAHNLHFIRMLDFLHETERRGTCFTVSEMITATGYKDASVRTYITKRLLDYLIYKESNGRFVVRGSLSVEIDAFTRHMSQKSQFTSTHKKDISSRLLDKSLDSFLLSIELYNRPTQRNRIEAFCILLINAWELLLKSEIVRQKGESAIIYRDDPSKSISIADAIKKQFSNQNDPIRKNLEYIVELRDHAVHLLLPEINRDLSRLFQASVINYHNRYVSLAGVSPIEMQGPGLISIVVDGEDFLGSVIKKKYGETTASTVEIFLEHLKRAESSLNTDKFSIPIEYKVTLARNPVEGDITISSGKDGSPVTILPIPKDANKTHPHLQSDVIAALKKRLPTSRSKEINQYSIRALFAKNQIKNNSTTAFHHYIEKPPTHKYSDALIDMLEQKIREDEQYIINCVESYKNTSTKKRRKNNNSQAY